ncbi:putative zinc-binding metallopeptidase [Pseudooceanicola sp. LIPI14-2-Ac024]|uniref:zinc-binding metallopeptidase family protein n=1 Tax=Pseudooceanicola sp. LIPI14-2-Ac024 TaxID=3344875 RepID=UPI0035CEDE24
MRIYDCTCGAPLFIDNTVCTNCGRAAGWCEGCGEMAGFDMAPDGSWTCTDCGIAGRPCTNYSKEHVCNRVQVASDPEGFCRVCRMNEVVPNLEVEGNRERWARLESAKRRLVYALDLVGMPYGDETDPPLRFSFLGDGELAGLWRRAGEVEQVYTGHADGLVTINIREADSDEREAIRVDMGEAHRTLIGHLRHEVGHYYWDVAIKGREGPEAEFAAVFGNPWEPAYGDALERHYAEGPPDGWEGTYVSSYATMHPWEDWAETFALWLAMVGVLDTAVAFGFGAGLPETTDEMVKRYGRLGVVANELNREMGLLDFAPVVVTPAIQTKLEHVTRVVRSLIVS